MSEVFNSPIDSTGTAPPGYTSTQGILSRGSDLFYLTPNAVFKSSDGGVTYTALDADNQPNGGGIGAVWYDGADTSYHVWRNYGDGDGSLLYQIAVTSFDLTSGTWGSPTPFSNDTTDWNSISPAPVPVGSTAWGNNGFAPMGIAVRSDGSYVVTFQNFDEPSASEVYERIFVKIYSGGAWGSSVYFDGDSSSTFSTGWGTCLLGAEDRVHIFCTEIDAYFDFGTSHFVISGPQRIVQKTLTFAGTLEAGQTIDTQGSTPVAQVDYFLLGAPQLFGGSIYLPYQREDSGLPDSYLAFASSADTPTWTVNDFSDLQNTGSSFPMTPALYVDPVSGDLWIARQVDSGNTNFKAGSGSSWSAAASLFAGGAAGVINSAFNQLVLIGASYAWAFSAITSEAIFTPNFWFPAPVAPPVAGPIAIRITKIVENENFELECEAEPFWYGTYAPIPLTAQSVAPYQPQTGADPGDVNTPVFVEPPPRLSGSLNTQELWIVASGATDAYGGAQVYMSTDGGTSYQPVGTIQGNAITGVLTADWPAGGDPDTTNDLSVDLTESQGELESYSVSDEDNFLYPCMVEPGAGANPYELMTYAIATLTTAHNYTLVATGGGTNHLRRAVFGMPTVGAGVDHPTGSRFTFLGRGAPGVLKIPLNPSLIGVELHFKFLAFNSFLSSPQALSAATDYTFTPTGVPGPASFSYTQTPATALSNPTSTTIDMAQVSVAFPGSTVNYNARTFTIPAPASPTQYFVFITDPGMVGDTGSGTNLTATCTTSSSLFGVAGYTYIGSIVALAAGGGTTTTPGGYYPGRTP
jgi:hypothetical protein